MACRFIQFRHCLPASMIAACLVTAAVAQDTDNDGIPDDVDNCTVAPNGEQRNTNDDPFGNSCDADFNNDGIINIYDLVAMKQGFFGSDEDLDLNGDDLVAFADLAVLKSSYFQAPGPAASGCLLGDRYQDMGNGTVLDCNSRLLWLKDASCDALGTNGDGTSTWDAAGALVQTIGNGVCGLSDGSAAGEWRLPTPTELCGAFEFEGASPCPYEGARSGLVDSRFMPALSNTAGNGAWSEGQAFADVSAALYWSSQASSGGTAWTADLNDGAIERTDRAQSGHVWPVRRLTEPLLSAGLNVNYDHLLGQLRKTIDPPCDPRPAADGTPSPCASGSLLSPAWDQSLTAGVRERVDSCSLTATPPAGYTEVVFASGPANAGDTITDEEFAIQAFEYYAAGSRDYNAVTGFAQGAQTTAYKTLVGDASLQYACAARTDCPGALPSEVSWLHVCWVSPPPPAGVAYKPLLVDNQLLVDFNDGIVQEINAQRQLASPTLLPVTFDDELGRLAAQYVRTLRDESFEYRTNLVTQQGVPAGELISWRPEIRAVSGSLAVRQWVEAGALYDLVSNTCEASNCGEYTQVVDQNVTKVGCAQAWHAGQTFVVCTFDFKAADGPAHIDRPF